MNVDSAPAVGGDAILSGLGEAFDLEGLFRGGGEWEAGEEEAVGQSEGRMEEDPQAMPVDQEPEM